MKAVCNKFNSIYPFCSSLKYNDEPDEARKHGIHDSRNILSKISDFGHKEMTASNQNIMSQDKGDYPSIPSSVVTGACMPAKQFYV